jgi:hypothetical protein
MTAECDESCCIEGGYIWSFFRRGARNFVYHESYCDESVMMTIYAFLNIQLFCDVSSGVGYAPI